MNVNELPEAELFDMDGTLCDVRGIRHYVTPPMRDFHAFHMASAFCPPHPEVVERVHEARAKGRKAIIVTARMARYRTVTRKWLEGCEIPFDGIWMRANDDLRKDYVVKKEILTRIRLQYRVVKAHDDNPAVIRLWQEEGIETEIVPGWDDQFTGLPLPGSPEDLARKGL
ncbi:hypothetical protein SEA_KRADAL_245 [Streptomyces phage Kradal]|nr:hypothetical protein SEA_KRADAL_245 [Streptomyces phage Kradal]QPL14552.1 phosphatase [Streptomyces phage EhyElimayoE]